MESSLKYFSFAVVILAFSCSTTSRSLESSTSTLNQFQFSDLDSLMNQEKRPVAVFFHAAWCKFCKNMEQTTFQNKSVIQLLNDNYYFISFDGEQKEPITFRNHEFKFKPSGRNTGTHELATALGEMDGGVTYPSFVLLNKDYEIVFQHNSFMNSEVMKEVINEALNSN